jgi:hypothetical protein
MKKQRVSPTANLTPNTEALKTSFRANNDLPSPEAIEKSVGRVMSEIQQTETATPEKERNKRKRETIKGTILQAVMIEMDLLKKVKREAFDSDKSLSDVINNALKQYFQ